MRSMHAFFLFPAIVSLVFSGAAHAADAPDPKLALSFRPTHRDVEYEQVPAKDVSKCKVDVERGKSTSGWVVMGPSGQVLRRYLDTNGDNVVDQWRYFQHGLEVYRDIDSDFDNKVDQSRWFNTGGSRWGVDKNEDGRIETWKILSAEEASREAVKALAANDAEALETLLVTEADLKQLGVDDDLVKQVLKGVASPKTQLQGVLSKSRTVSKETQWMRFDTSMPGLVPSDAGKADRDLHVYQNGMAIAQTGSKTIVVQMGEMIRLGDVWKLTQIPRPLEGDSVSVVPGVFMQPALPNGGDAAIGQISPELRKLLEQLQEVDKGSPRAGSSPAAMARYNERRAKLIKEIVKLVPSGQENEQWIRQMVDGLAAAVQTGESPGSLSELKSVEKDLERARDKTMLPYAAFRRMQAEYALNLQKAKVADQPKIQIQWLKDLEEFAKEYPKSDDAGDAMLQLAMSLEFAGKVADAKKWYEKITTNHRSTNSGVRAAGALKRLGLRGETLALAGPGLSGGRVDTRSYRGKALLVIFWSTWCKPCTEDLPQIQALYREYRSRGFEIMGVNLDTTTAPIAAYLREHKVDWPHIREDGGLDSPPAREYGIISLPTMFLVDKRGKVVSRGVSVEDLKDELPKLLK